MHSHTARILFEAGARLRNPSLFREYERVKESEWLSAEQLAALQLRRAVGFLTFAYEHSPYFRRLFEQVGFRPATITSLTELSCIPPIDKETLIRNNREIHSNYQSSGFTAETSGTTGSALEFFKSEVWDSTNRAHLMRAYDWYGVKPWERYGYLWGYNVDPARARRVRFLDALQNRFRLFSYDAAAVRQFAEKLQRATYAAGYSSMIYEVARIIQDLNLDRPRLRLVKGTSEMVLAAYQDTCLNALGRKVTSEYGAAEAGLIAFECPMGSMHINVEDVFIEIEDDGGVLVTNLVSHSFPIIRYRLGDVIALSNAPCPCGRAHPVISEIIGRRGAKVIGKSGSYPALTFYYVFKNIALTSGVLLNYKAVQSRKGEVVLFIEGKDNQRHAPAVERELGKYFSTDVAVECRFVDVFERKRAKAQYFESEM